MKSGSSPEPSWQVHRLHWMDSENQQENQTAYKFSVLLFWSHQDIQYNENQKETETENPPGTGQPVR